MSMPGYTGEAALHRVSGHYQMVRGLETLTERGSAVQPQQVVVCTGLRITCNLTGCYLEGQCFPMSTLVEF
jgi:hypothetical protein